ncbi:hypothetical protein [Rhodovulum sulfidophilum]|uniref:hypothetical protein n=1 Tax=Rhodovulum sulfidophilum TaxID=35806 RepID=UPI00138A1782|nr:hypothetical protein [Rhodovulum sulfidophilum]NDK36842.1 hypothetical protein [Rhodovulum sulfidophilum]
MTGAAVLFGALETPFGDTEATLAALRFGANAFHRHPVFIGQDGRPLKAGFNPARAQASDLARRLHALLVPPLHAALDAARDFSPEPPLLLLALPACLRALPRQHRLFAELMQREALPPVRAVEIVTGDHAAALRVLPRAFELLAQGHGVLWAAVDSLVAPVLQDLDGLQGARIFDPANPYAPVPSEAACVFLLSAPGTEFGPDAFMRIGMPAFACEPFAPKDPSRPPLGKGLEEAAKAAWRAPGSPERIVSDLNGERFRAEEYGVLARSLWTRAASLPVCPAVLLGETGTASPLLGLSCAISEGPGGSLLLQSDRSGERAAMAFQCIVS